jgi:hypothetical protein
MRRWPRVEKVKLECGSPPGQLLADSGYFSLQNLQWLEQEEIDAYLPDSNMGREMNLGKKCRGRARRALHRRMRQKRRSPHLRQAYAQPTAIVELGFGVLEEQRGTRQFRTSGIEEVTIEFTLANLAYNLTRMYSETAQDQTATSISRCRISLPSSHADS